MATARAGWVVCKSLATYDTIVVQRRRPHQKAAPVCHRAGNRRFLPGDGSSNWFFRDELILDFQYLITTNTQADVVVDIGRPLDSLARDPEHPRRHPAVHNPLPFLHRGAGAIEPSLPACIEVRSPYPHAIRMRALRLDLAQRGTSPPPTTATAASPLFALAYTTPRARPPSAIDGLAHEASC